MASFFQTFFSALCAVLIAPYISYFLNREKDKQQEKLKYLKKSYQLAIKIEDYARQTRSGILFTIATLKGQIKPEKIPKQPEGSLLVLYEILDFYLQAPDEIKKIVYSLYHEILNSHQPIIQAVMKNSVEDVFFVEAIKLSMSASETATLVQEKVITWLKKEKESTLEAMTIKNCWGWVQKKYGELNPTGDNQ